MQKVMSLRQKIGLIICGVVVSLIFLETGLRIGGVVLLSLQKYRNIESIKKSGNALRILCLGESTTFSGGSKSWPAQLEVILNKCNKDIQYNVINGGVPQINTDFILYHLEENLNRYYPHIVITMMGVNDGKSDSIAYDNRRIPKIIQLLKTSRVYRLTIFLWKQGVLLNRINAFNPTQKNNSQITNYVNQSSAMEQQRQIPEGTNETPLNNDKDYIELGWRYRNQAKYGEAAEMFRKAAEINPRNEEAYIGLGVQYMLQGNTDQAETMYKKAIEISPLSYDAHFYLGWCYRYYQGNYQEVSRVFNKAIEINPKGYRPYFELGGFYFLQKDYVQAEKYLQIAMAIEPQADIFGLLAQLYFTQGRNKLAEEYFNKANDRRRKNYNPMTVHNYNKLKDIVFAKGLKLICVQYAVRDVECLKNIFVNSEGIIFVDNESVFKEAISRDNYTGYFTDAYGGDFGHCTPEGNSLLAENIANVISREY